MTFFRKALLATASPTVLGNRIYNDAWLVLWHKLGKRPWDDYQQKRAEYVAKLQRKS